MTDIEFLRKARTQGFPCDRLQWMFFHILAMSTFVAQQLRTFGDLLDGAPAKGQQDVSLLMDSFWRIAVPLKCE
jgi:hypothetical protein